MESKVSKRTQEELKALHITRLAKIAARKEAYRNDGTQARRDAMATALRMVGKRIRAIEASKVTK